MIRMEWIETGVLFLYAIIMYLVLFGVALGWVVPLVVGIRRMKSGGPSGGVNMILGAIVWFLVLVVGGGWMLDGLAGAKGRARMAACSSNLRQIGVAIENYRMTHEGAYPEYLSVLTDTNSANSGSVSLRLICPNSVSQTVYSYRVPVPPFGGPVCWDSEPHRIGRFFTWLRSPTYRNIFFADGRVETLTEAEFQKRMSFLTNAR